jgi:hypothetical protein
MDVIYGSFVAIGRLPRRIVVGADRARVAASFVGERLWRMGFLSLARRRRRGGLVPTHEIVRPFSKFQMTEFRLLQI